MLELSLQTVEKSYTQDMGYQIVKLIVHFVHMIHDYGRKDLLDSYVKVTQNLLLFSISKYENSLLF